MKAIRFLIFMIAISMVQFVNGQSKSDKMYDVFANKEGVINFSFSKNMVDAININVGEDDEEQKVTGDLQLIRFMSYNPKKGELSGSEFTKKAIGYLPKTSYKKFEDDGDNDAEIWLLGGKRKFKECHVFTNSDDDGQIRLVVSFYGDFTVSDLDNLKKKSEDFSNTEE